MTCPSCGSENKPNADGCKDCPHIFNDNAIGSAIQNPKQNPASALGLMMVAFFILFVAAHLFVDKNEALREAAKIPEDRQFDYNLLQDKTDAMTAPIDDFSFGAAKAIRRITGGPQALTEEEALLEKHNSHTSQDVSYEESRAQARGVKGRVSKALSSD